MSSGRTAYTVAVDEQVGAYHLYRSKSEALQAAYARVRHSDARAVTVLRVTGPEDDRAFEPLVTVTPPVIPTFTTSPEAPA